MPQQRLEVVTRSRTYTRELRSIGTHNAGASRKLEIGPAAEQLGY
jgi:hypothetical protein